MYIIVETPIKAVRRLHWRHNMNKRPKSEDPLDLIRDQRGFVPDAGFEWVAGEWGPLKHHRKELFLVPRLGPSQVVTPPTDVYLELLNVKPDEQSTLDFANRFGRLGLENTHFHHGDGRVGFGESSGGWGLEIAEFKASFEMWQAAKDRDVKLLKRHAAEMGDLEQLESMLARMKMPLVDAWAHWAKGYVVDSINRHLGAALWHRTGDHGCFSPACNFQQRPARMTNHLCYRLNLRKNRQGETEVNGELIAQSLLTTIWLQFADLICGRKAVHICQVCHRYMDVTETDRRGSKRMHSSCSRRIRMQRYRERARNGLIGS